MLDTIKRFEDAITELDGLASSGEVARFLVAKGVKGRKGNPGSCPLATYLGNRCEADARVHGATASLPFLLKGQSMTANVTAKLPTALQHFVEDFDNGEYPELVAEGDI